MAQYSYRQLSLKARVVTLLGLRWALNPPPLRPQPTTFILKSKSVAARITYKNRLSTLSACITPSITRMRTFRKWPSPTRVCNHSWTQSNTWESWMVNGLVSTSVATLSSLKSQVSWWFQGNALVLVLPIVLIAYAAQLSRLSANWLNWTLSPFQIATLKRLGFRPVNFRLTKPTAASHKIGPSANLWLALWQSQPPDLAAVKSHRFQCRKLTEFAITQTKAKTTAKWPNKA